ncbi:hypothetical protein J6590_005415 [Homalodisca vitripennis]|nr:hypothetical protein J6590_005415 [Homalodisca vitripennis]
MDISSLVQRMTFEEGGALLVLKTATRLNRGNPAITPMGKVDRRRPLPTTLPMVLTSYSGTVMAYSADCLPHCSRQITCFIVAACYSQRSKMPKTYYLCRLDEGLNLLSLRPLLTMESGGKEGLRNSTSPSDSWTGGGGPARRTSARTYPHTDLCAADTKSDPILGVICL